MTCVQSVFHREMWQHTALSTCCHYTVLGDLQPAYAPQYSHVVPVECQDKEILCFADKIQWQPSPAKKKKRAMVLNRMKAARQVGVEGICSSPLLFDLCRHWLNRMMFIAEKKKIDCQLKNDTGEAQVSKTDAEIYPAALMIGLAGKTLVASVGLSAEELVKKCVTLLLRLKWKRKVVWGLCSEVAIW